MTTSPSEDFYDQDSSFAGIDKTERYDLIEQIATNINNSKEKYDEEQEFLWDSDDVSIDLEDYMSHYR